MSKDAFKFSWLSNAPWSFTGYGNQTKLFLPRFKDAGYDPAIIAFYGHEGMPIDWGGIMVYGKAHHQYGQDVMCAHTKRHGAEVMITLMDAWVVDTNLMRHGVKWVPWFPVDSDPLPHLIRDKVAQAHKRIVYSKFGERMVNNAGLDCYYVPHGIDTVKYCPGSKKEARNALRWPQDKYIFGMIAANKGNPSRKAFQQHLDAFAQVRNQHDDVMLYLHTDKCEGGENGGFNIPEYIDYLEETACKGITESIIFCDEYINVLGFPDSYMVNVYRAMDVHVLASMGEGFGLPTVEAQACGTPVITTEWTASGELCFGGWKIKTEDATPWWNPLGTNQFIPHAGALAEAMELAYRSTAQEKHSKQARKGALKYDVDLVVEKYWLPVLAKIENSL